MKPKAQFKVPEKNAYAGIGTVAMFLLGVLIPAFIVFSTLGVQPQSAEAAIGFIYPYGRFGPGVADIFTPLPFCGFEVNIIGYDGIPRFFIWGVLKPYDWFAKAAVMNPSPFPHLGLNVIGRATVNPNPFCGGIPLLLDVGTSCSLLPGVRCDILP